jgi:hypothetical protein
MVAEVVLSVMGNRSDRRFPNLSCAWALEAVEVTRRKRADFHQGQERTMMLLKQAEYMAATASPSTRQSPFARGWVHIRDNGIICLLGRMTAFTCARAGCDPLPISARQRSLCSLLATLHPDCMPPSRWLSGRYWYPGPFDKPDRSDRRRRSSLLTRDS